MRRFLNPTDCRCEDFRYRDNRPLDIRLPRALIERAFECQAQRRARCAPCGGGALVPAGGCAARGRAGGGWVGDRRRRRRAHAGRRGPADPP